jgi:hypothetical protein
MQLVIRHLPRRVPKAASARLVAVPVAAALVAAALTALPVAAQETESETTEEGAVTAQGDPCEDRLPAADAALDDFMASIDSRQLNRLFTSRDRAFEACASGNSDFAAEFVEEFVGLVELALLRQRAAARGELSTAELLDALDHAGYEDVEVVADNREAEGSLLIQGTDVEGREVELEVDVTSGEVLRETLVGDLPTGGN